MGLRLPNGAVLERNDASVIETHMLCRSPRPLGGHVDNLLYVFIDLTSCMRITKTFDTAILLAVVDKLCQSVLPDKVAEFWDCNESGPLTSTTQPNHLL